MANAEHMRIVKQGTMTITEWREAHLGRRFDLRNADFSRTDLSDANLS